LSLSFFVHFVHNRLALSSLARGGLLMIWLADGVSAFLSKNRMFEVLGLFVLLVVGIMLLSEGGHLAHMKLFGNAITPMTKTTFYFVITVLVIVDLVQTRYQRKLVGRKRAKATAIRGAESV
jgi:predicted tellurium resistance membrane protein TerC